jgi:hypothetical protein
LRRNAAERKIGSSSCLVVASGHVLLTISMGSDGEERVVTRILKAYARGGDLEGARDELHDLGPRAKRPILDAASDPKWAECLDLLVMVLADDGYPPALPRMREWIERTGSVDDIEGVALPAASALDAVAGGKFDVDRFWSGDWAELPRTLEAIAAWWDAGVAVPSEAEWLEEKLGELEEQTADEPPPSPAMTLQQRESLRARTIELVQAFEALDPGTQHRLELQAVRRVLPIYSAHAPSDRRVERAVETVARWLEGASSSEALAVAAEEAGAATQEANTAASWNPVHKGWMRPGAHAAGCVAQAVLYLCSPEPRNRLQTLHFSRDALDQSGAGVEGVRAELEWQLALVRGQLPDSGK